MLATQVHDLELRVRMLTDAAGRNDGVFCIPPRDIARIRKMKAVMKKLLADLQSMLRSDEVDDETKNLELMMNSSFEEFEKITWGPLLDIVV